MRISAKRKREEELLVELQRDHGYMFFEYPVKGDRYTMQFSRNRANGKTTLTPARKITLAAPSASFLARGLERSAKRKEAAKQRLAKARRRQRRATALTTEKGTR